MSGEARSPVADRRQFSPLAGVRILDLSHVLAGPYATFMLAQLGATVVKVEPLHRGDSIRDFASRPDMQGLTPGFVNANGAKQSLALNLTHPEGLQIARELVRESDILIENFRPGKTAKLGLGFDAVCGLKPDIIYCSISAWGQTGEMSPHGGFDHVLQAATGMMMMQGDDPEAPPIKVGFPLIDMATGMQAANAVMAALLQRRTGDTGPVKLDISMADAALFLMAPMAGPHLFGESVPFRVGNKGFAASPGSSLFRTGDGWLATGANTLGLFEAMCTMLGHPEYATAPDYLKQRPDSAGSMLRNMATAKLDAVLVDAFRGRDSAAWEKDLMAAGVPAAAVRTLPEYLDGLYRQTPGISQPAVNGGGREGEILSAGYRVNGNPVTAAGAAPQLGEHTDTILSGLRYSAAQIAELRRLGIVQ